MFIRKGLTLALAGLFFATLIVSATVIQGAAGGGPAPPPPYNVVGPEITGAATLTPVPGKPAKKGKPANPSTQLKASMTATYGGKKVTLTYKFDTQKPADGLTDEEITTSATRYFLPAGSVKGHSKTYKPASGKGDLMVVEITDLKVQRDSALKIKKIDCQAKLTYIVLQ